MRLAKSVIKQPQISEKATDQAHLDKYVFIVHPSANKHQVRQQIQDIYKVTVDKVNIVRNRSKAQGFKKAVVTLRAGDTLDVVPK